MGWLAPHFARPVVVKHDLGINALGADRERHLGTIRHKKSFYQYMEA